MIESLAEGYRRLSARERILLVCFAGFLLPVAVFWGVALPLVERREAARDAVMVAHAEQEWLYQMRAERERFVAGAERPSASAIEPIRPSGIEASLIEAGLREAVAAFGTPADDVIALRFQTIGFVQLMSWLQVTEQESGYRLVRLQLTRGEQPGNVVAEVQLEARRP